MGRHRKNLKSQRMKDMRKFAREVVRVSKRLAPEDTGALASAITLMDETDDGRITIGIRGSTPYPGPNKPSRGGFGRRPRTVGEYMDEVVSGYHFESIKRPGRMTLKKRRRAYHGERADGRFIYRAYHAVRQARGFRI